MDTEAYSEPCKTSEMEYFAKIFRGFWLLIIFTKRSISGVWQGSEKTSYCEITVCQLTACEITVTSNCQAVKYWGRTFLQKYCRSLTISISDVLTGFSLLLWNQSEQNPYPTFSGVSGELPKLSESCNSHLLKPVKLTIVTCLKLIKGYKRTFFHLSEVKKSD